MESSLIQGGYKREDVFVAHPEMLHKSIGPDTKVVGINVMDPLGMAQLLPQCLQKNCLCCNEFQKKCVPVLSIEKEI